MPKVGGSCYLAPQDGVIPKSGSLRSSHPTNQPSLAHSETIVPEDAVSGTHPAKSLLALASHHSRNSHQSRCYSTDLLLPVPGTALPPEGADRIAIRNPLASPVLSPEETTMPDTTPPKLPDTALRLLIAEDDADTARLIGHCA